MPTVNLRCQDNYWKIFGYGLSELLKNEKLTDLRFVTTDTSGSNVNVIKAHQFLFTPRSLLLQDLVDEAKRKQNASDPVFLTLPGVEASSIQALINYFYFGYTDMDTRDELEDICCLLGIEDIGLDEALTDIKWDGYYSAGLDEEDNEEDESDEENQSFQEEPPMETRVFCAVHLEPALVFKRVVEGPLNMRRSEMLIEDDDNNIAEETSFFLEKCINCDVVFAMEEAYRKHAKDCFSFMEEEEVEEEEEGDISSEPHLHLEESFASTANTSSNTNIHSKVVYSSPSGQWKSKTKKVYHTGSQQKRRMNKQLHLGHGNGRRQLCDKSLMNNNEALEVSLPSYTAI